jgi:hypothetical protein
MTTFKDALGRDWIIQVNYSARERVKALCGGLDLFDPQSAFSDIGDNPVLLIETLYAVCQPAIEQRKLAKADFVDSLTGESLEQAADALIEAYINFSPPRKRPALTKMQGVARQIQAQALAKIEQVIDSGELLEKLQQSLKLPSGDLPESSASTPAPSPSGSST